MTPKQLQILEHIIDAKFTINIANVMGSQTDMTEIEQALVALRQQLTETTPLKGDKQ